MPPKCTKAEHPMIESIKNILVVDDEANFTSSLKRHLRREGFLAETASDGKTACKLIEGHRGETGKDPFDLVVTDVLMPHMDGFELLGWIKENRPNISVIVVTGYGDVDFAMEKIRPGMDAFCKKPITPREMMILLNIIDYKRFISLTGKIEKAAIEFRGSDDNHL